MDPDTKLLMNSAANSATDQATTVQNDSLPGQPELTPSKFENGTSSRQPSRLRMCNGILGHAQRGWRAGESLLR